MLFKIVGKSEQTHIIYTDSLFFKGYIYSSLSTSKESSVITFNYKPI